jgi:dipeptidyl aminopeptidase/acylaminoacyl peptidase
VAHEGEPIVGWLNGLGVRITSMETETYRPARMILLGDDATPELRRATSLDALVTRSSPPLFVWHTAEDAYVPPEHTCRLAASLAAHGVPHTAHVFAHGPHSLGLARGNGDAAAWTTLAASWITEQQRRAGVRDHAGRDVRRR